MTGIFIGQILPWVAAWLPNDWVYCKGQQLPVMGTYQDLFGVIGFAYGGDGRQNFAVPNLGGQVVVGQGQGKGLSNWRLGQQMGNPTCQLDINSMPVHSHQVTLNSFQAQVNVMASNDAATTNIPYQGLVPAAGASPGNTNGDNVTVNLYSPDIAPSISAGNVALSVSLSANSMNAANTGGYAAHPNMMPYLPLNYIICYQGAPFPTRP